MNKITVLRGAGLAVLASLSTASLMASPASATSLKKPVTGLVSVATNAKTGNNASTASSLSSQGTYVAFVSSASNLVTGDTNGQRDLFVRNTLSATTTRVSVASDGTQANGQSDQPSISANGRFVAFRSEATNLVPGDTNAKADVFVRDLRLKTTVRASVKNSGGGQLNGASSLPTVSDDGVDVVFLSDATNAVDFDLNAKSDVFVRNLNAGFTEIASVTSSEVGLTSGASSPSMSGNGRYVVFDSDTTQVGSDTNGLRDIFLRDRVLWSTERVSIASNGDPSDGTSQFPSVSDDGRYVAFQSIATDLTPATDSITDVDVFRRDRTAATTELISRTDADQPGNGGGATPEISSDGKRIAFLSDSTNMVSGDTNSTDDVFIRDVPAGTTTRTSVKTLGGQLAGHSLFPSISPDGGSTSFSTLADDGYAQDTNQTFDVYVRSSYEIGPFADSTALIQHSATDFNGKALTIGQLVGLNDKVLYGTASPSSTIDDLAHGTFDDSRGPVMRLYWAFFHRMPDLGGLNYWVAKYDNGMTLKTVANNFAKSSEFKTKYGSVSNDAFITLVYQNVLERNPDAAGHAHWVGRLSEGVTRGEMMTAFSESSEGIRKMRGEIDSVLLGLGMLHRLPTAAEFPGWVNFLEANGGQDTEFLILNILTSSTYAAVVAAG